MICFNDGTLYPVLRSLEEEYLVESEWEQIAGERKRRVYRLTESGERELQKRVAEWKCYSAAVDRIIEGVTPFAAAFDLS